MPAAGRVPILDAAARATLILIVTGFAARLVLAGINGLGVGEAYYAASARVLALSYFDQPPLSLWLLWAVRGLAGADPVLLRLPFLLLFAGSTWAMYRLARDLFGPWAGFHAALLLNLSTVFTWSIGTWAQPDGPLVFFLLAACRVLLPMLLQPPAPGRLGRWLGGGVLLGLALLSKYHAVLLPVGALAFLLTSRDRRRWLLQPGPWLALGAALLAFAPVLAWNAQQDWASFAFQSARGAAWSGIHPAWLVDDLAGQAVWLTPWIWLALLRQLAAALRRGPGVRADWLLACLAVPPIAIFTAISSWAPIGDHFHWQAPGYLMLFPLLGRAVAAGLAAGRRGAAWFRDGSLVAGTLLVVVVASHAATGWATALAGQLRPADDPSVELLDWDALYRGLAARGLSTRPRTFAVVRSWYDAGKVDAAIGDALPVICLSADPRNIAYVRDHRGFRGWDAVIVTTVPDVDAGIARHFVAVEPLGSVDVARGGHVALTLWLSLGRSYDGAYPLPLPVS